MAMHDYLNSDDKILVSLTLKGDNRAFEEVVRRYEQMVARTVISMVGDIQQADDIGQETFIRLFNSLKDFRGDSKLSTYIQRIAINQSLNEIKRKKRLLSLFYPSDSNGVQTEIDISSGRTEDRRDIKEVVNLGLSKLEPGFRTVVVLRLIQGYSTKETAEILDLPLGTVLSRLARAKVYLKEILDKLM